MLGRNLPAVVEIERWQDGPAGPGLVVVTEHYRIYTTLLDPLMLGQIPSFMEAAYREYNNQLGQAVVTSAPFTIYLFDNRQQWEAFTDDFAGDQAPMYKRIRAGAYYLNDACVAYNIGRERTMAALGHEGWHQFSRRHFRFSLPSWLDEGIAMLFESYSSDNGRVRFTPERNTSRLGGLRQTLLAGKMIPLAELVGLDPGQALSAEDNNATVTAFYSQSYALMRFLREEDYGRRLGSLRTMLRDGLNGSWPISQQQAQMAEDRNIELTIGWNRAVGRAIFEHYISSEMEEIEQQYLQFCRKIVYNIRLR